MSGAAMTMDASAGLERAARDELAAAQDRLALAVGELSEVEKAIAALHKRTMKPEEKVYSLERALEKPSMIAGGDQLLVDAVLSDGELAAVPADERDAELKKARSELQAARQASRGSGPRS